MNLSTSYLKTCFMVLSCVFVLYQTNAANFTSTSSGEWDKGATWGNPGINIPGIGYPWLFDNAVITSGKTVQVKQSEVVNNVTINSGGVVSTSNNKELSVYGNYIVNGIHTGGTGSSVTFYGSGKTISGIGTIDLEGGIFITTSRSVLSGSALLIASDINLSSGVTITNNGKVTMISPFIITASSPGPVWVNAANSYLSPGSSTNVLNNVTLNASAIGNTVNYYQTPAQNIKLPASNTYYNLLITGTGTKSLIGNITVLGDLSINATTLSMSSFTLTIQGNWTNEGVLSGTGTVVFSGTNNQTITNSAGEVFYNMTSSKSSGHITLMNDVSVSNILTLTSGQIDANLKILSIGTSTSALGTLNYISGFVYNGFVKRWVNATGVSLLFPMGIQYGSYYAPLKITFNNLASSGALMVRFPPIPGSTNNGLPLVDGGRTVYNTFGQGVYSLTPLNGLSSNSYNAEAVGLPFYPYYTSTRILARPNSASNWVANGTHQPGVAGTGPAKRANLTMLPADLVLADTVNCTSPVTAPFTGSRNVCKNSVETYSVANTGNTFLWVVQGGTQVSGGNTNTITVNWGNTGMTGVLIVIEQSACGSGIPAYDFITIAPTSVASITGKDYAPENTAVGNEETYSILAQPGYTYSWNITGGTIVSGGTTESVDVRWGAAGTGQISVSITNGCGTSTVVKPVNIFIVINSIKSGSWDNPDTWDCNCVPAAYNSVRVRNPHVVTFPNSDLSIANLISDIGGTFNNTTTKTLTVTGDILMNGVYSGSNQLIHNGSGSIDGIGTISTTGDFTITGGDKNILSSSVLSRTLGSVTIASGISVNNYGVFTTTGNIIGSSATATWINEPNSTLNIGGAFMTTGTTLVSNVPNTVEYTGSSSQNIRLTNYYNLSSSGSGARVLPSSGTVGVAGDFNAGTNVYTITGSTVNFNGTDQNISAFTFNNLTVSGGGIKTLTGDVTYNGILNLTSGIITTGTNTLTGYSTGSVSRTIGHVNGNFKKWISNTSLKIFEIGTATDYTPLGLTFSSVSTAGYVTAKSTSGDHPSIASACLDALKSVNLYYSLTNNTAVVGTAAIAFNYLSANVDGAATPSAFNVQAYSSGTWSPLLTLNGIPSSTLTSVTGVSIFGDYQIAQGGLAIATHPVSASVCSGLNTSFSVAVSGAAPTYKWQVNTSGTWSDIVNGGVYSNSTTASLTITAAPFSMNSYQYRAIVTGTQCGGTNLTSNAATLTVTPLPTAVAGTAIVRCAGSGAVNITAGSSATNQSAVAWTTNGTGTFANANSLTIATYNPSGADITAGSVILTLTATGTGTCSGATATSTKTFTITPTPTSVAGTAISTCSGSGAVNITTGSSATNQSGIAWTSNGTGTFANAASLTLATYNPSAADITAGNVTLTLTATGNAGCSSTTATSTKTLTITPAPTAVAGTAITTCANSGAVSITTGSSATNQSGIAWTSSGTGTFANANSLILATYNPSAADITAGNVTLTLTVTGSAGCLSTTATSTKTFTITPLPTSVAGTAITTCSSSGAVNITAGSSATNQSGIAWTSNGTGTFANATSLTLATYNPSAADITASSVTLTLTVTGAGTCSGATATSTKAFTISPPLTAVAGTAVTTCSSSGAVNITAGSSATNQSGITWTSSGTGTFANANSLTIATYNPSAADITAGSVTLTLTATNSGCGSVTSTKTFSITSAPTGFAGTGITVCEGSGASNITAGASASNYSGISWSSSGTGTFAGNGSLTGTTYTPGTADATAGSITLSLTVTGTGACSGATAVSTKTVTITALPVITSTSPATRCGTGTVTLSATASAGTLDWYAASSGGSSLGTGTSFITPAISATTIYYVAGTNLGCPGARTAVTATVDNACTYTWTGTASTLWNVGSNWSTGNVPTSLNDVTIPSSVVSGNMPAISTNITVKTLSNTGAITLTGTGTLNVYGNVINSGTVTTVAGSTINMAGSSAQTISGLTGIHNLSISNSAGVSLLSALTVNGSISLISGVLTTNNYLTLNFDAGGNIAYHVSDAGSISGNVSGTRNLVAKSHYISTPFVGVTSGQIDASTPIYRSANGAWLMASKKYNTQSWDFIKNYTTTLSPISGYSLGMFNAASLTMTGSYSHTASYSSGDYANTIPSSITKGMFFMVGNPYPSTLDWNSTTGWTKTNIDDAIYFWNPVTGSVSSYVNGVGTNGATQYIPAMQSFLVSVPGTGGMSSVLVNNNARVLTNASYFRTSPDQLVRLAVRNAAGTSVDETVVRLDDVSSADFESGADAYKIGGSLSLYTKNTGADTDYSINTLPLSGPELRVPLNLKVAGSNGLYTIECKEYSVAGYSLVLEDKQTQSYTLLNNSTIYTLTASSTDSVNRFVLRFVANLTTGVMTGSGVDLQISTYDNQMMLHAAGIRTENATINVYDASGLNVERFSNQRIASGIQTIGLPGLPSGVYIVKVEIEGVTYVGKVVLK